MRLSFGIDRLRPAFDRDHLVAVEELEAVELRIPDVPMQVDIATASHLLIALNQTEVGKLAKRGLGAIGALAGSKPGTAGWAGAAAC